MKKRNDQEVVTKGFLKKELKKELNTFGLKLKKEIKDEVCFEIRNEMDSKFGALYENMKNWKDEILKGNDQLMRRFDHFEKENASVHLNYRYLKGDVEDLQTRVTVLEKTA